jgi:hypothetical protein
MEGPYHCPSCGALVVDRRFANCTTCHAELPAEWVLTPEQIAKLEEIDRHARAEHAAVSDALDPLNSPDSSVQFDPDDLPGPP